LVSLSSKRVNEGTHQKYLTRAEEWVMVIVVSSRDKLPSKVEEAVVGGGVGRGRLTK
jgi:hypothetical protein